MTVRKSGSLAAREGFGGVWVVQDDSEEFVASVKYRNDARLFAASPELLEACEQAFEVIDGDLTDTLHLLESAIAKAKGGAL